MIVSSSWIFVNGLELARSAAYAAEAPVFFFGPKNPNGVRALDMLDDPAIGGGIRHVGDCFDKYLSENKGTPEELVSVAERLGNGAVFKRLGFVAERRGGPEKLITSCRDRLTTSNAKLDPPCQAASW